MVLNNLNLFQVIKFWATQYSSLSSGDNSFGCHYFLFRLSAGWTSTSLNKVTCDPTRPNALKTPFSLLLNAELNKHEHILKSLDQFSRSMKAHQLQHYTYIQIVNTNIWEIIYIIYFTRNLNTNLSFSINKGKQQRSTVQTIWNYLIASTLDRHFIHLPS